MVQTKKFCFTKQWSEKLSKIPVLAGHRNALRENHPPQTEAETQTVILSGNSCHGSKTMN